MTDAPPAAIPFAIGSVRLEDGIVVLQYEPGRDFELEHVQPMRDAIRELVPTGKALVLSDPSGLNRVSAEARATSSEAGTVDLFAALALLGTSPLGRMIGNFFIRTSRPRFPTRMFTDRDEAVAWLRSFEDGG